MLAQIVVAEFSLKLSSKTHTDANEYMEQCIDAAGNNIAIHHYDMMVRRVKTCDKVGERLIELFKNEKLPKKNKCIYVNNNK